MASAALCTYGVLWASTLAAAATVALAGSPLRSRTRGLLGLSLSSGPIAAPHLSHVLALAAHNVPIAAWPLLLGLTGIGPRAGIEPRRSARWVADSLVAASILANTAPVGAALGAYGARLIVYIPQLPLEWAALALGYGSWLVRRQRPLSMRERLSCPVILVALLICAAVLETFAVPDR